MDERRIAETVQVAKRESQRLWGDGGAGGSDGKESIYRGPTCVRSVSVTGEGKDVRACVACNVGVEIKGMCIVYGTSLSSSGRVLVRNFGIDRVNVHHAGDDTKA